MNIYFTEYSSKVGNLFIAATSRGICRIAFDGELFLDQLRNLYKGSVSRDDTRFNSFLVELEAYFRREPVTFDIPLDLSQGTEFQKRVWDEVRKIPYGQVRTYGEIAAAIGSPRAARAVGAAVGANPIPIVIPCHRVVGIKGRLVGYSAGLEVKKTLLRLEGVLNYW